MSRVKTAVLISGRGSNLQSLLNAAENPDFPAEISIVISNRPKAAGIERAREKGVSTEIIDHRDFQSREDFDEALNDILKAANVRYVCLAGFMRMLTPWFVDQWRERLINIHPSLLPAFKGLNVHERMLDAGVKIAGCTVHFVSSEMDSGPIIGQSAVAVRPDETADSLAARILVQEHKLYPACLELLAAGKVRLSGAVVRYDVDVTPETPLINPHTA